MERIGIYGGTYNPPHQGHIRAAKEALRALKLSKLLMIPDRIAPHKAMPGNSPTPEQRLQMLRLAIGDCPDVEVSDLELRREGPSFTWQTVEQLRQEYPEAELVLLMGTDMFLSFLTWKKAQWLLEQVTLGVLCRGEKGERPALEAQKRELEQLGGRIELVDNEVLKISSTDLRRLLVFGCAAPLLPEGVEDYIRGNGLYETAADYRNLPMEKLEKVVVGLLNPNRVAHVLGCRDAAVKLAKRWGADETEAARAGLLHDITKALDGQLQLTLCREYGTILDEFSLQYPKTLHAFTGALVAERVFGETQTVVSAIRHHTTGKADMSLLEKIIYVADYIEPCRSFPGVEELRRLAFSDLDGALQLGLEMTLEHLKDLGDRVSPASREALAFIRSQRV